MRRTTKLPGYALFGALITAALGFGATAALADVARDACNDPMAYGSCASPLGCENMCLYFLGDGAASSCSGGCCYCFPGEK